MKDRLHPPPRLLTGCTLLFWGAMNGRPLIGLFCALLVEARYWVPWRWDFDDAGCARAWQLSTLLTAVSAVLLMLEGSRYTALPDLLTWIPVLMMPVQFVQSYGLRPGIPLNAISYFARRNRKRALRLGLPMESRVFHFGNAMFFLCLISASVGKDAGTWMFLPGVLVLGGWRVLSMKLCRLPVLLPVLVLAGLGALVGEFGLRYLEQRLGRGGSGRDEKFDPTFAYTMIGTRGDVVLSPEIKWRVKPEKGFVPSLLRTASFSLYVGNTWQVPRSPRRDFEGLLDSKVIEEKSVHLTRRQGTDMSTESMAQAFEEALSAPKFLLRGASVSGGPLPLPGSVVAVSGFEMDAIEVNSMGTIRVYPKDPVMNGTVYWQGAANPERPPDPGEDLRIPRSEKGSFTRLMREAGLDSNEDVEARLTKLKAWFASEFRYTRRLSIGQRGAQGEEGSPIFRFLNSVREGHCEYFATGAVLLLREAGIPARYATGFAVSELDGKRREFVIRGTHAHAWCRVWDGKRWIDFDPTPPDWLAGGPPELTLMQRVGDFIQRVREDFFVWRTQPGKDTLMVIVASVISIVLGGFVGRRLWKSRSVIEAKPSPGKVPHLSTGLRTPLHDLEPVLKRMAGPRPAGEPYAAWVERAVAGTVAQEDISEAVALHQRMRFDTQEAGIELRGRLDVLVDQLRGCLGKSHAKSQ